MTDLGPLPPLLDLTPHPVWPGAGDKPLRVSATLYTTYKNCPVEALGRVNGHYQPDSIHSFKGLLAHRIFAHHLTKGAITPSGFEKIARAEIGGSDLSWKMQRLGLKPAEIREVIAEVSTLYRRFQSSVPPMSLDAEIHVEYQMDPLTTMIGTIDAATKQGVHDPSHPHQTLTDWKTGELGDVALQLRFYAALWVMSGKPMPLGVEAVSIATGEKHSEWVTEAMINELLLEVSVMVAELRTGTVGETPGPFCRWCPLLDSCEVGSRTLTLLR